MDYPRFVPYTMKTTILAVTSYNNKIPVGTLSNPHFNGQIPFHGVIELVFLLEKLQNELNYPQRSTDYRSFTTAPQISAMAEPPNNTAKPMATFKLSILFRQNSSWQGTILWTNKNESAQFRSLLELLYLLDSALDENPPQGGADNI